ncbi:3919_t:CDS:1 [Ambispora leptoticha]|uniref:3919_t:CDS:1 n=1 Tax=Ambispora leptoticha TaxID=144679 RepID=A0A9N9CBW2_9GLOM|nr:3919_t:CDS:1 [Ambispora leptoticha]
MTKYVTKSELPDVFQITEQDIYQNNVIARRLGSMEQMMLLLGKHICHSSIDVLYLPTNPPETRSHTVLPIYMINNNESNPYWSDMIEKYFARPTTPEFNQLTYPDYWKCYKVIQTKNILKYCNTLVDQNN